MATSFNSQVGPDKHGTWTGSIQFITNNKEFYERVEQIIRECMDQEFACDNDSRFATFHLSDGTIERAEVPKHTEFRK